MKLQYFDTDEQGINVKSVDVNKIRLETPIGMLEIELTGDVVDIYSNMPVKTLVYGNVVRLFQ